MVFSLGKNLAAFGAIRHLDAASYRMQRISERMSSGLRINRASDDAAGLAIASGLNKDARVFGQAVRNGNDALSALDIADGTLGELTNVLTRLRELATQASNGTFSRTQRLALDAEGQSLTNEFNRLVGSIEFNGLRLLDGRLGRLNIQLGYGTSGSIGFDLGSGLSRRVGTGFSTNALHDQGGLSLVDHAVGDINGDGNLDLVGVDGSDTFVSLGNGDGTFKNGADTNDTATSVLVTLADLNSDGKLDMLTGQNGGGIRVRLGNGDGSFGSATVYGAGATDGFVKTGDFNGDGKLDYARARSGGTSWLFALGNGNGTFGSEITVNVGGTVRDAEIGDFNSDGKDDIALELDGASAVTMLSAGTSFQLATPLGSLIASDITIQDMDYDGILDLIVVDSNGLMIVAVGNGDGTFKTSNPPVSNARVSAVDTGDVNGDGIPDIVGYRQEQAVILLGNGDGTFMEHTTYNFSPGADPENLILADLNNDGVSDISASETGDSSVRIILADTVAGTTLQRLNFTTRSEALDALAVIDAALGRVGKERGTIGANQSRIYSALNTLFAARENSLAAEGRIKNADMAEESAALVRNRILQQAGASVLSQANLIPTLILDLLR